MSKMFKESKERKRHLWMYTNIQHTWSMIIQFTLNCVTIDRKQHVQAGAGSCMGHLVQVTQMGVDQAGLGTSRSAGRLVSPGGRRVGWLDQGWLESLQGGGGVNVSGGIVHLGVRDWGC